MRSKTGSSKAHIQITIEVPCGTYGPGTTLQQIHEQAAREGTNAVAKVCQDQHWKIVSEPVVLSYSTKQDASR